MNETHMRFPEYGIGGDYAGARRSRRAFRFLVLTGLFVTLALWFAENYLRYGRGETQYRMALTLPDDSARAILRNVVKREAEEQESPNPKHVAALAFIEEEDLVLERYQQAYELAPRDQALLVNYGCHLFLKGQYQEARERFREAGVLPPKNALPHYLEAAALAAGMEDPRELSEPIAIIARANNSGDPVHFPQPLWHPSLPRNGITYATTQRRIADLCCAPLYRLRNIILAQARKDIDMSHLRDWDSWLEKLEILGARLLGNPETEPQHLGTSQAIAGLQIQSDALDVRVGLLRQRGESTDDTLSRLVTLQWGLKQLQAFEEHRSNEVAQMARAMKTPIVLAAISTVLFLALYLGAAVLNRLTDSTRVAWALPHPKLGKALLAVASVAFFLLLWAITVAAKHHSDLTAFRAAWYVVTAAAAFFGFIHPALALPSVRRACEKAQVETSLDALRKEARSSRRKAYTALLRRYYGVLLGLFLCVLCAWVLTHRVACAQYPGQLTLQVPGLRKAEVRAVRDVQRELSPQTPAPRQPSESEGELVL